MGCCMQTQREIRYEINEVDPKFQSVVDVFKANFESGTEEAAQLAVFYSKCFLN